MTIKMSTNLKKIVSGLVAFGHLNGHSPCPCCAMKKMIPLRALDRKKEKVSSETQIEDTK